MHTTLSRSPVPIRFHVLATTATHHVLMVRGSGENAAWVLPNGEVGAGRCPILAAREKMIRATGYDRSCCEALAFSLDTDEAGRLTALTYVLDGGELPRVPADANRLPERVGWLPLRELNEPPSIVQYAIIATNRRRRIPLLINGDRPEAAFL
ncbi:hypothetical protein [Streptomyces profundus]|uniref:hypothetical protein n=1 Tax=Streptomyces profundus TaxID=2867410 RepID=UPI001D168253|nr:hypothetical protein [Streptomyces sp. MA3_2.13]UED84873.1 hypothetical protein K4G22_12200 [Streptomyces sp. MA3_2.13]